jgi:hypothetical protein
MSAGFLEQLNLTPQERRIVVGIGVAVFVILNFLLVLPHFGDLARVRADLEQTRRTIEKENALIAKDIDPHNGYQVQLKILQQKQGGGIGNQQIQLQRSISDQAIRTGVAVSEIRPVTLLNTATNAFYEEQSVKISFECQESNLINFLFNIGNDPAVIRVREINLRTADANRYRLRGDATLSANYAKQPPKAAAPAPGAKPLPGRPATATPGAAPNRAMTPGGPFPSNPRSIPPRPPHP